MEPGGKGSQRKCSLALASLSRTLRTDPSYLGWRSTHRPRSSSILGLPFKILNMNHKKERFGGLGLRAYLDPINLPLLEILIMISSYKSLKKVGYL